jgi:hypothetical protein
MIIFGVLSLLIASVLIFDLPGRLSSALKGKPLVSKAKHEENTPFPKEDSPKPNAVPLVSEDTGNKFTDVYIEKPFQDILLGNPLLIKLIKTPEGNYLLLGIASTVLKDHGAEERLRAEQVCKIKAIREVVATTHGVQIGSMQKLEDRVIVVIDKEGPKSKTVSDYLQITTARVEGIAQNMMVIGRWQSKEGKVFYLAVGKLVDRQGMPIPEKIP